MTQSREPLCWHTKAEESTRHLGRELGRRLVPGLMIALEGELGAGKTVLASGILEGAGAEGPFRSPTFTLVWEHQGRWPLFHVDLYRLTPSEAAADLPWDRLLAPEVVSVVEWADRLPRVEWPVDWVSIQLCRPSQGERRMKVTGSGRGVTWLDDLEEDFNDYRGD